MTTPDEHEAALRTLPEGHSLALRLHDAGVADDVICGYLHIEPEGLGTLLDLARRKFMAALKDQKTPPEGGEEIEPRRSSGP
ncbi:hypothetical protein DVS77_12070 [Mycolicibacterium moriokaense]|nr:hypothetical protein DVS77_12070 [Mycolicibacterium moriokaense]